MNIEIATSKLVTEATIRICGFNDYRFLITRFNANNDLSEDTLFQKRFTYFYRLRRARTWLDNYYRTFEEMKHKPDIDFPRILSAISEFSDGRIEISFASKMLATINPDMPIWDRFVRDNLELAKLPLINNSHRFEQSVRAYEELTEKMNYLLSTQRVKNELDEFDTLFPSYADFTPMKKLDYLIWGSNRT